VIRAAVSASSPTPEPACWLARGRSRRWPGNGIHQAALAIRARIPIEVLLDQVAQFPTYTEGYLTALEKLPSR